MRDSLTEIVLVEDVEGLTEVLADDVAGGVGDLVGRRHEPIHRRLRRTRHRSRRTIRNPNWAMGADSEGSERESDPVGDPDPIRDWRGIEGVRVRGNGH